MVGNLRKWRRKEGSFIFLMTGATVPPPTCRSLHSTVKLLDPNNDCYLRSIPLPYTVVSHRNTGVAANVGRVGSRVWGSCSGSGPFAEFEGVHVLDFPRRWMDWTDKNGETWLFHCESAGEEDCDVGSADELR